MFEPSVHVVCEETFDVLFWWEIPDFVNFWWCGILLRWLSQILVCTRYHVIVIVRECGNNNVICPIAFWAFHLWHSSCRVEWWVCHSVCTAGRNGTCTIRREEERRLWPFRSNDGYLDLLGRWWCLDVLWGIHGFCWPTGRERWCQSNGFFLPVLWCSGVWQHWFCLRRMHLWVAVALLFQTRWEIVVGLD